MPVITAILTTWVCDMCARGRFHTHHGPTEELAFEELTRIGWIRVGEVVYCDRCKRLPDATHSILAAEKAPLI